MLWSCLLRFRCSDGFGKPCDPIYRESIFICLTAEEVYLLGCHSLSMSVPRRLLYPAMGIYAVGTFGAYTYIRSQQPDVRCP